MRLPREIRVEQRPIETPVARTMGTVIANPKPLVVPILRAGLGMLEGMTRLVPTAEVGFLGMARNERDSRYCHLRRASARRPDRSSGVPARSYARYRRHLD